MKYSKEKAAEVLSKFEFKNPVQAEQNWRSRGEIPDKYFKEGFTQQGLSKKQSQYLGKTLDLPYLNLSQMRLKPHKFYDHKNNTTLIKPKEYIDFLKDIAELKTVIRKFTDSPKEKTINSIIEDVRIKHYVFFNAGRNNSDQNNNAILKKALFSSAELTDEEWYVLKLEAFKALQDLTPPK